MITFRKGWLLHLNRFQHADETVPLILFEQNTKKYISMLKNWMSGLKTSGLVQFVPNLMVQANK